jgi:hypothetical protein
VLNALSALISARSVNRLPIMTRRMVRKFRAESPESTLLTNVCEIKQSSSCSSPRWTCRRSGECDPRERDLCLCAYDVDACSNKVSRRLVCHPQPATYTSAYILIAGHVMSSLIQHFKYEMCCNHLFRQSFLEAPALACRGSSTVSFLPSTLAADGPRLDGCVVCQPL